MLSSKAAAFCVEALLGELSDKEKQDASSSISKKIDVEKVSETDQRNGVEYSPILNFHLKENFRDKTSRSTDSKKLSNPTQKHSLKRNAKWEDELDTPEPKRTRVEVSSSSLTAGKEQPLAKTAWESDLRESSVSRKLPAGLNHASLGLARGSDQLKPQSSNKGSSEAPKTCPKGLNFSKPERDDPQGTTSGKKQSDHSVHVSQPALKCLEKIEGSFQDVKIDAKILPFKSAHFNPGQIYLPFHT